MGKSIEVKPLTEGSDLLGDVTVDEEEVTLFSQRMTGGTNLVKEVGATNKEMLENTRKITDTLKKEKSKEKEAELQAKEAKETKAPGDKEAETEGPEIE